MKEVGDVDGAVIATWAGVVVSGVLALAALRVSVRTSRLQEQATASAERSAQEARRAADAAERADQFAREEAAAQAASQARTLVLDLGMQSGGLVSYDLINTGTKPLTHLEVESLTGGGDADDVTWRVPPTVFGARSSRDVLDGGQRWTVRLELLDVHGQRVHLKVGSSILATHRYRDAAGVLWRRTGNGDPERINDAGGGFGG